MQVAPTLVPLLKFYFHEEVRKAAVSGMVMFLISFLFRIMHISGPKRILFCSSNAGATAFC